MINWFNNFKLLLPRARAWCLEATPIKQFFEALATTPEEVTNVYDNVFDEINPYKTGSLEAYEEQFALAQSAGLTEAERRQRLDAAWKATGGQDPAYIQRTLQGAGFNVFVHEWWTTPALRGSVNGVGTPVARDPREYIRDDVTPPTPLVGVEHEDLFVGSDLSSIGTELTPSGYLLVNKLTELQVDGGGIAAVRRQFAIPSDRSTDPFFMYIGGEVFGELATIPNARRDEFEDLCLKICPTEQWLGILVQYI